MKNWSQALTRAIKENDRLKTLNSELLGACKLLLEEWDNRGFPELNKLQCYSIEVLNGFALIRRAISKTEEKE